MIVLVVQQTGSSVVICFTSDSLPNTICTYVSTYMPSQRHLTVYALTFAGLNFRGLPVFAIFAFLFSRFVTLLHKC